MFLITSKIQNRDRSFTTLYLGEEVNMFGQRRYTMDMNKAALYETAEAAQADALANKGTVVEA